MELWNTCHSLVYGELSQSAAIEVGLFHFSLTQVMHSHGGKPSGGKRGTYAKEDEMLHRACSRLLKRHAQSDTEKRDPAWEPLLIMASKIPVSQEIAWLSATTFSVAQASGRVKRSLTLAFQAHLVSNPSVSLEGSISTVNTKPSCFSPLPT